MKVVLKLALKVVSIVAQVVFALAGLSAFCGLAGCVFDFAKGSSKFYRYIPEEAPKDGEHAWWVAHHLHSVYAATKYYHDKALDGWKWIIS